MTIGPNPFRKARLLSAWLLEHTQCRPGEPRFLVGFDNNQAPITTTDFLKARHFPTKEAADSWARICDVDHYFRALQYAWGDS